MDNDIIIKLNYIIDNVDKGNQPQKDIIINFCLEQIENFSHDKSDFVNEYNQYQNKQFLGTFLDNNTANNKIKLPKLTPQELNIPNDMNQIRNNIIDLYNGIHEEALDKTKKYILEIVNHNNSASEILELLDKKEDKIIQNNFKECINQYIKADDFQDAQQKSLLEELRRLIND